MIESTDGHEEQHDLHVVENVDPLLSFRTLTADVEHLECEVTSVEDSLANTCRSKARTQNVLISGNVVLLEQPAEVAHVAKNVLAQPWLCGKQHDLLFKVVMKRILVALCNGTLYTIIIPQVLESVHAVQWHGVILSNLWLRANEFHSLDVLWVLEGDLVLFHCALNALEGVDQVVEDGHLPLPAFTL